jgi:uncharacterized protein YigA (DUF484 family)
MIKQESNRQEISPDREQQLAADLNIISLLRENPDILQRYPELLTILEVPHKCGTATSLIEKQVMLLRQQKQEQEKRLQELMDIARDNERLALSRHNMAVTLLSAHDLDDVVSIVLAVLRDELAADYAVIKLFSNDKERIKQNPVLFIDANDEKLKAFKTMLEHKNTVCGKSTKEQKVLLFGDNADHISSAAIIPLVAGANLGLIGLGSNSSSRFHSSMGTDFLSRTGELVSASLATHLEQ